jgi:hypothetical protein
MMRRIECSEWGIYDEAAKGIQKPLNIPGQNLKEKGIGKG